MHSPVRGNVRLSLVESLQEEIYRCYDCNVNFTSEHYLLGHLLHHIKQPAVLIRRLQQAPIKITLKSKSDNNFEIITSPRSVSNYMFTTEYLAEESQVSTGTDNSEVNTEDSGTFSAENLEEHNEILDEMLDNTELGDQSKISFSADFIMDENEVSHNVNHGMDVASSAIITDLNDTNSNIQSTERETPPSQSSSPTGYPKIRIKTTGLLKERLTITEITDDNPNGECTAPDMVELSSNNENNTNNSSFWSSCLEDPLKIPEGERDDSSLLTSFLNNNNDQAKAFGITTDSEFISLDRLDDRNRSALQVYNPTSSTQRDNSLENLTGLPMQQLAEQVSRLQPSGSNGMHQQNVLINIQQFPQAPPQTSQHYQHPPMFPPHPPHPVMSSQPPPLYQPYQYQPSPMYYPPTPSYPPAHPHMPPPRPPQMQQPNPQMPQQPIPPHPPQQPMPPPQPPQYRQAMPPRPPVPRQFNPSQQQQQPPPQRGPTPRASMVPRQRGPMMRPRGAAMGTAVRGPRPRMPVNHINGNLQNQQTVHHRVIKRTPEQIQSLQAKKKRIDVLVPDKNDDADCQVIAVQPKNTDGGLPQIQSVQGGTTDPVDNVMHLSDSITLSVRNPPPKCQSPKKSDAKDVANILATRGITVTASPKTKEKMVSKAVSPTPVAINLNSAVSIIPTAKQQSTSPTPKSPGSDAKLPTVDLTDDAVPEPARIIPPKPLAVPSASVPVQKNGRSAALPFKCDLCPAQYPTLGGLSKHRQTYHKTGSPCEIGIPLIDLKQPGVLQKLSGLGITNFIPMPSSTPDGHFVLPVVTLNAARNSSICNLNALGASSILSLGPVRALPKSQMNNVLPPK